MNPILLLDYAGVAVFAATGALAASRRQLDIIGFLFLASVTGIGGGTFRDLILNVPVFWVENRDYLLICASVAVIVFFSAHLVESRYRLLLWLDAIGLAAFAVMGAAKGLTITGSPVVAVVTGMLTATFGGILRDLIAGEPSVLLKPELCHRGVGGRGGIHICRCRRASDFRLGALRLCGGFYRAGRGNQVRLELSPLIVQGPSRQAARGHRVTLSYSSPTSCASSRKFLRGRGPICWMTMPAASESPAGRSHAGSCRWCSRTGSPPRTGRRPRSCRPAFRARSPGRSPVRARRDDHRALFRASDRGELAILADQLQRRLEGRGLVERLHLALVGEDDVDRARAHQVEEFVAVAVDAERVRQASSKPRGRPRVHGCAVSRIASLARGGIQR